MPTLVAEASSAAAASYIASAGKLLFVSDATAAEVSSALSRLVRTRVLTAEDATERLANFDTTRASLYDRVTVQAADFQACEAIVRRFDLMLKAPDGLHVAIAQRLSATLVTFDTRLATAARALGLVVDVPA